MRSRLPGPGAGKLPAFAPMRAGSGQSMPVALAVVVLTRRTRAAARLADLDANNTYLASLGAPAV